MKKQTYALFLSCLLIRLVASAQVGALTVPERTTFADITVQLDPDARRIVQQDVDALLANRQYWTAKLDRVVLYFPMIEAILINESVPTDFKYLAVQESSLTPDAVSSSTAVGYWQFKRETAMDYGLRVDNEIDERKSITASTHGAARYMKKSNAQFNNWVASLYSYYLGAGGISKLIPPDWAYAREVALDGRTDRYILRFFAHKIAIENALQTHQTSNRFALIEYPNGGGKSMRAIAEELGVDEFELRKYNRWVLGDIVPTDKAYVMAVPTPSNQINDVREKIVNVSSKKTPDFVQNDVGFPVLRRVTTGGRKNDPILYEINGLPGIQAQAGDNAASLARKARISLSSFLRYNDMNDDDPVLVSDIYYLAKKRKKALVPFHTIREGETSRSVSQRYGLRLKKLLRYNRLDRGQTLETGRVVWLRERRPANKPVEIITAPTPPVYDQTPTPPTQQDVVANAPASRTPNGNGRSVSGSDGVPRNASERKLYQPKLVGGGVTPNDGTSAPAVAQPSVAAPAITTSSVSTSRPAPTTSPNAGNAEGSQRVVIVRTPDGATPAKSIPVATTPETVGGSSASAEDGWRPAGSKATRASDTYARNQPKKTAGSRSESEGYNGPLEQQADGSLTVPNTKTSPRPSAPAVVKTETRSESPVVTTMPEKKPVASATTMPEKKSAAPAVTPSATGDRSATTHMVEPGQTYYSISKLYGLTVDELLAMNNRTLAKTLEVGQRLKIKATTDRVSQSSAAPAKETTASASPSNTTYHTVAKGENLFRISKTYGISVEQLQEWNSLSTAYVREGQKIRVVKP